MTENSQTTEPRSYLTLLSHLSRIIGRTQDLSSLLESSVDVIQSVLEVESCSIMLLNETGDSLTMEASSTIADDLWEEIQVRLGEEIAGKVAQSGKPILATGGGSAAPDMDKARNYHTSSYLCVPLRAAKTIIGVVNVTDRVDRRPLTEFDLEMLQAVSEVIASAIGSYRKWQHAVNSREHLARVIEDLPVGIFSITTTGLLTLCNPAARGQLNLPADFPLDQPWKECFPEVLRTVIGRALERIREGESSYSTELEVSAGNGAGARSVRISAVKAGGIAELEERHYIFIVEDVRQMKELLDLRRSDELKSDFLMLISHELRTPLAAIKGSIHLFNQMAPPDFKAKAERIFLLVNRNADRLTRLVDNVLNAMELDAKTFKLYRKRTDLHPIIERIVEEQRNALQDKSVHWEIETRAERHDFYIDEARFEQAVRHLIENAVKFTPDSGTIRIETSTGDGNFVFRVVNSGRQIAQKERERIFSKFYQIDGSLTRNAGGSGLGLYLSREIIRLHDGEIELEMDCADGVSFRVTLPENPTTA